MELQLLQTIPEIQGDLEEEEELEFFLQKKHLDERDGETEGVVGGAVPVWGGR